ncbi:unnamed protein product [Schistocephalus solidus]|uniref:Uncharacterized protein n=1 Tax=Schistocephalus solidus TaxID=70667 RepID=A0A3P7BFW5_SCHSO|nr:unnamed protein product [Schistocephalus solidus]
MTQYDEYLGIVQGVDDDFKEATKCDSFKSVPVVEFVRPLPTIVDMIQNRIFLSGFKKEDWTDAHTEFIVCEFVPGNVEIIFFHMRPNSGLRLDVGFPSHFSYDLNYFMRTNEAAGKELTPENFETYVQYGSIIGQGIESLMRVMSTVYAPAFFASKGWPDSIKNDFALQLHRFMSALTDTRWKLKFKTVLYIPTEGMNQTVEEVSKDKDLVTRLELIVIHWTRQIKEVLTSQNMMDDMEGVGPLEEIDFWKNRCDDLMGISKQLDNEQIIHVSKVLTLAKSSYINAFIRLAEEIKNTSSEAMSNLKFLNTLKEMCTTLSDLPPAEIPPLLPRIINQIRMIWVNSDNYNTKEAITGLFRKVSNEIITRCCSVIRLEDIFQGRVRSASLKLQDCINCCEKYKEIYEHIAEVHRKFSTFPWDAAPNSIFAQVDAFIQRCKDLMEICECQAHFGRYDEGKKAEMPIFQGARGPEVELLLTQIENMFAKLMANLNEKRSLILNVKATSWHDEYNRFRSGVKDLEIMMQNGINLAFETVTTIQQGVEVLDIFAHLQKREAIRRTLDANTHAVIQLFLDGIQKIKQEMSVRPYTGMPLPREPTYGIQGILWRFLRRRLEKSMQHLDQAFFLPTAAAALEEHRNSYTQLCLGLEELTRKVFNDFQQTVESDPLKCLEVPILIRNSLQPSKIEQTFHASVLKLINELDYWVRLGVETPHYAAEAQRRKPELRALNEMVLVLVREYNRIMNALNPEEKALFQERIKMLDKKIAPGFTKIQWPVKSMVEHFINDCRLHACRLQSKVDEYKAANANIKDNCELIARTLLIKLEPGRVYENNDFDEQQVSHRRTAAARLMEYHKEIVQRMREVKETFVSESPEIQAHWTKYTEKMDRYCEEAFRLNVKFSLSELQRAINGDGRNEPNPLFKILLTLDNDKLVFLPTMPALTSVVISLNGKIISVFAEVPRLPAILARPVTVKRPISEHVENDEEIMKIQANITRGITEISKAIHNPLAYWDQFREIWELPKDEIIRKYREFNPHVSSIDADIARYTEVTNKVLDAEAMVTVRFLQLDFSLLKNAIAAHCRDWQVRLTNLLMDMTVDSLNGIYDYMATMQEKLAQIPQTLEELVSGINLLEEVKKEQDDIQAKFVPLEEQFAILDKCEVTYTPEVTTRRANLAVDWARFQEAISEAEQLIKKSKEKFKAALLSESDMLKRRIGQILQDLQSNGPFAAAIKPDEALDTCKGYRDRLAAALEREAELRRGLMLFKIEQPPCKETILIERELETLETIWGLNKEFEEHWATWKAGRFMELKTYEMETLANSTFKKFTKFSRELRDRNWEVVEFSRQRVDQFRRTLPLISDLRNEAMRPRHWAAIKREMGRDFDETADDFTLEKIVDLGFDQYAGMINELSSAATKELAIEKALIKIDAQWEIIELDVVPHKDKGHFKIRSVDELTQTLEDHQVQLSTMKASRFVKPFEDLVDKWERALSKITEVSEMLLLVQRQWVYMETIFMGEDIRKQLPKESAQFDQINKQWKAIMTDINVMRNAKLCSEKPGLFEELTGMNVLLEEIEKSLDMYLETKRQLFPRFYFISNEDLLEILGQGRNPEAVLPHLKKCFDNINTLKLEKKITQEKVEPPPKTHAAKSHARKGTTQGPATPSDASTAPAAAPVEKPTEGAEKAAPPDQPPPPPLPQPPPPQPQAEEGAPDPEAAQSATIAAAAVAAEAATETAPEEAEAATTAPEMASPAPAETEAPTSEVAGVEAPQEAPPPPDENVSNVIGGLVDVNNSSAARVARRRQLRAMYFGSSHSSNNVGSQIQTFQAVVKSVEAEDNARLMRQIFFSETHNVGDAPAAKKGVVNVIHFDALSMFSADGEEVPFKKRVRLEGPVESWLCEIEDQMRKTLRDLLRDIRPVMKKVSIRRERVIKEWSGQICLTCSQIQWTADVTRALMMVAQRHDKKPLRNMRKKQRAILKRLSETIRSNLTKMQRLKMNGLVVIEVHQRDIIERLYKVNCNDTNAFDWLAQLRFYWEKDEDDCFAKQTNTSFRYGYEYLGNSGRLVITPLTDRCYITLTTALSLNRGGSPKGPAGTGKTETTKDLGKSLGGYVIVINCSDGLDYKSMGRMFSGLAQTGAWGCFDEFNRINIEVLSVVAQQILAVLSALASMPKNQGTPEDIRFMFEGRMIKLVWSCGIFITMNPGYAGRTELPDNLKSMFRPIAMVVPDSTMIAEITLFAEGFNNTKTLAKKVFTLYSLSVQQLSKQDHYDFGLRALISVLRYAGRKKRANPGMQEEEVLLLSMNDMNLAKMTAADLPLFRGIVSDLFPNIEIPTMDYTKASSGSFSPPLSSEAPSARVAALQTSENPFRSCNFNLSSFSLISRF